MLKNIFDSGREISDVEIDDELTININNANHNSFIIELKNLLNCLNNSTDAKLDTDILFSLKPIKRKEVLYAFSTRNKRKITRESIQKDSPNSPLNFTNNTNITNEEESNSLTEISVNSDKTDCDEMKIRKKSKIPVVPLQIEHIEIIISKFLSDDEDTNHSKDRKDNLDRNDIKDAGINSINYNNELDFLEKIIDKINLQSVTNLNPPVKCLYLRRRVCYKLYKVFQILVRIL
jgi:hypothetical protein